MWSPGGDDTARVTCIACGSELPRAEAREYDKEGDRWERQNKEFEYLCKECHSGLCHQSRDGLEATLIDVARDTDGSSEAFAAAYQRHVADDTAEGER